MPRTYVFRNITSNELRWHPELDAGEGSTNWREWFYLDGQFPEQGYECTLILHGGTRKAISADIMTPDGTVHRGLEEFPSDAFKAEPFGGAWGDNALKGRTRPNGQPEGYDIELAVGNVAVQLKARTVTTGVKFVDEEHGYTYYNPVKKLALGWWPLVPRAEVEATLTVDGKAAKVRGLAYLERQLASMPLGGGAGEKTGQAVWCWGHFFAGDYTAVWTDSAASEHYKYRHFTPFVLWKGGDVMLSTYQFAGYVEKFEVDPNTGIPYPLVETVKASDGHTELTAQLLPGRILQHAPDSWYCRQYCDVNVQIRHWGETEEVMGESVHEWGCGGGWFPWKK